MDVRSIVDVEPEVEHNGTVPVWYLVKPRELHDITEIAVIGTISAPSAMTVAASFVDRFIVSPFAVPAVQAHEQHPGRTCEAFGVTVKVR